MHVIVWEFLPRPDRVEEFERAYGPDGDWARLFSTAEGYLGTTLLPPEEPGGWYRTEDRWASRDAHMRFLHAHAAAYAELDRRCEALTAGERLVGCE